MANRFGLKEVANVTFYDTVTDEPVLFFNTLKVSTIENAAEQAFATGGQGNARLVGWDYSRTANVTMQDALLSDESLAMLAGSEIETTDITIHVREVLPVGAGGAITLSQVPLSGSVKVYATSDGKFNGEKLTFDESTNVVTGSNVGSTVIAFYSYESTSPDTTQVTISADKFPSTYKVVGDTFVRQENGKDAKFQFVIDKAKLQAGFTLTMDAENVSVFDFNLEVLRSDENSDMIKLIKY